MRLPRLRLHQAIVVALSVPLLALALPKTVNSAWQLWTIDWGNVVGARPILTPAGEDVDAKTLETIAAKFDDPELWIKAGALRLKFAYIQLPATPEFKKAMKSAADDLALGLQGAPANARAWALLAGAELAISENSEAQRALRTSLLLGPNEMELGLWRMELGMRLWPKLDDDDRELVANQIRLVWAQEAGAVSKLATGHKDFVQIIAASLSLDTAASAAFNKAQETRSNFK